MSSTIAMVSSPDDLIILQVKKFIDGATYERGGTTNAEMVVTANYSNLFVEAGIACGIGGMHGMTGLEATEMLQDAVTYLGTKIDVDYWKATHGNAGACLNRILGWCLQYPTGIIKVN